MKIFKNLLLKKLIVFPTTRAILFGGDWGVPASLFGHEGPDNLFDDNFNTKACKERVSLTNPASVIFTFGYPCCMSGYSMSTANDFTPARNPRDYTWFGSDDALNWEVIIAEKNRTDLPSSTYTTKTITLALTSKKYMYFKLEVYSMYCNAETGAAVCQLSKLSIF